jgi:hypothetical protein
MGPEPGGGGEQGGEVVIVEVDDACQQGPHCRAGLVVAQLVQPGAGTLPVRGCAGVEVGQGGGAGDVAETQQNLPVPKRAKRHSLLRTRTPQTPRGISPAGQQPGSRAKNGGIIKGYERRGPPRPPRRSPAAPTCHAHHRHPPRHDRRPRRRPRSQPRAFKTRATSTMRPRAKSRRRKHKPRPSCVDSASHRCRYWTGSSWRR